MNHGDDLKEKEGGRAGCGGGKWRRTGGNGAHTETPQYKRGGCEVEGEMSRRTIVVRQEEVEVEVGTHVLGTGAGNKLT